MLRLLVVDDDPDICAFIANATSELGVDVRSASSFEEFRAAYSAAATDAIILDLQMPDKDGVEYLRLLSESNCEADIVLISGFDPRVLQTATRIGESQGLSMLGSLQKPIKLKDLRDILATVTRQPDSVSPAELEAALQNDELFMQYQPKVCVTTAAERSPYAVTLDLGGTRYTAESFEALIRWRHPVFGLVPPGSFIPLAESCHLIRPVTEFVINSAIAQLRAWDDDGFHPSVALNFPPHLVTDLGLPDRLARLTGEAGIDPDRMVLEITETAAMSDVARSMEMLTRLRLKGFRLSMDDFGTGFSSLVQLHRMPFTELKIDRSIIAELGASGEAESIVRAIVELGHALGLKVCAEGVETRETLARLEELGCDTAQGFLFSQAVDGPVIRDAYRSSG